MWKTILKLALIDWAKQPFVEWYNKQPEEMTFNYGNRLLLTITMKDYKYTPNTFSFSVAKSDDTSDEVVIGLRIKAKNTQNLSKLDIEGYRFTEIDALKRMLIDNRPDEKEFDSKTLTSMTEEEASEYNEFVYAVHDFTSDLQSNVYGYIKQLIYMVAENWIEEGPKESDGAKDKPYRRYKPSKSGTWRSVIRESRRKNIGPTKNSVEKVEKMLEEIYYNWRLSRGETLPPVLIKYLEENGKREDDYTLSVMSKNKLVTVYLPKDPPENVSSGMSFDIEVDFTPTNQYGEGKRGMGEALTRITGKDSNMIYYAENEEAYNNIVEAHEYSKKKWKGLLSYLKME